MSFFIEIIIHGERKYEEHLYGNLYFEKNWIQKDTKEFWWNFVLKTNLLIKNYIPKIYIWSIRSKEINFFLFSSNVFFQPSQDGNEIFFCHQESTVELYVKTKYSPCISFYFYFYYKIGVELDMKWEQFHCFQCIKLHTEQLVYCIISCICKFHNRFKFLTYEISRIYCTNFSNFTRVSCCTRDYRYGIDHLSIRSVWLGSSIKPIQLSHVARFHCQ